MSESEFNHDDFEVVRVVDLFGGYEELRHKDKDIETVSFFCLLVQDRLPSHSLPSAYTVCTEICNAKQTKGA